jgi:hypothetical protein
MWLRVGHLETLLLVLDLRNKWLVEDGSSWGGLLVLRGCRVGLLGGHMGWHEPAILAFRS